MRRLDIYAGVYDNPYRLTGDFVNISQKCQYALRATFELAKHQGGGVTTVGDIAEAQAIPPRFLEQILAQLKQGGFVESRRGVMGGYTLAIPAGQLTVGKIIRFIDGPVAPVKCMTDAADNTCRLSGRCAFLSLWQRAETAVAEVYDSTTLQNLIDQEQSRLHATVGMYCI